MLVRAEKVRYLPKWLWAILGSHITQLQEGGRLSPDLARQWWEHLRHADERGALLISFTAFIIVGTRS
jgi:hypothetical protein